MNEKKAQRFEALAQIALDHKKSYIESAKIELEAIRLYPTDSQDHANEMAAVAHFRSEAYAWYRREQRALRQAKEARA